IILATGNFNATLTASPGKPVYYSVKINRVMRVRLDRDLDSEHEQVGSAFNTTLVDPLYAKGGVLLAPEGSTIRGHVTNVRRAQKNGEPAVLTVGFSSLRLPNGRHLAINGSLFDLSTSGATSNNEGEISANKTSKRNLKFIGGGAGGGA